MQAQPAYCYSRSDAAISTHSLPDPVPEVVSQAVGEAVWPYFYCAKQLTAGKGVQQNKQGQPPPGDDHPPRTEQNKTPPPCGHQSCIFSFFHASLRGIRPGGWRDSHMACMCVPQRAIARQPSSPLPKTSELV